MKKNEIMLTLNSLESNKSDPTIVNCTYSILDFEISKNNVLVEKATALEAGKTLLNKPIVCKYHQVSEVGTETDNFGGHEMTLGTDRNGNESFDRDTVPIGVFTSEGYIKEIEEDGVMKEVLVADAVMWKSKFSDAVDLLIDMHDRGVKINTSCEYLYSNYEVIDNVEVHKLPLVFESHCLLASEDRGEHDEVVPAYSSATLLELNQFKQLVAQAMNQEKEDVILEEVKEEVIVEPEEVKEEPVVDAEPEAVKEVEEEVIEVVEEPEVDAEGELKTELNAVKSEKEELAIKLNEANEKIISLNAIIEELKPLQEQMLNAQKEEKLNELKEKFVKAFNNAGAKDTFESEEVQVLLNEAIESAEALGKLNAMVVDLIMNAQVKEQKEETLIGLNSVRKELIKTEVDEFEQTYKL